MQFRADPKRRKLLPLQVAAPDIAEWVIAREPRAIGAYYDLAPEEYARAFTAAQTAGADVVDDLWFGLIDVLENGGTEDDFAKLVTPILRDKGWLGGDTNEIGQRVRLIYDTNIRLARSAGRWGNYQASRDLFPYLRAITVGDERVRHPPKSKHADHRAWDGIILPVEHEFWREYGPGSFDFRCRCSTIQASRSEVARAGGVTSEADLAYRRNLIGPPRFAAPSSPLDQQLAAIAKATNDGPRIPGAEPVDTRYTKQQGEAAWDAVLRAQSLEDVGRQLARAGF